MSSCDPSCAGDPDGVWASLVDAQRYICGMAAVLSAHLADDTIVPKDRLFEARWATPLNAEMEAAALSAPGRGGDGEQAACLRTCQPCPPPTNLTPMKNTHFFICSAEGLPQLAFLVPDRVHRVELAYLHNSC